MRLAKIALFIASIALLSMPAASAEIARMCDDTPPERLCREVDEAEEDLFDALAELEVPDFPGYPALPDTEELLDDLPSPDPGELVEDLPGLAPKDLCDRLPGYVPAGDGARWMRRTLQQAGLDDLGHWLDKVGDDLSEPRRMCHETL